MAEPTPQARKTGKAFGESLSDFPELTEAERKLVEHCRTGEWYRLGDKVPEEQTVANAIRPELIRFLVLGGDDEAPVHPKGVQLQGAWINNALDLASCLCTRPLQLFNCQIDGDLMVQDADLPLLDLLGSHIGGLQGYRVRVHGGLYLRKGFEAQDAIVLIGARIGGDLDCEEGSFAAKEREDGKTPKAIDCDRAVINGALFFRKINAILGAVDLSVCEAGMVADDAASWGKVPRLGLEGFRYRRVIEPTDAATRIAWLKTKQLDDHDDVFWPQPWEQLVKVLREMGHEEDAKLVAMAKQDEMRARGKIRPLARPFHALFGWFAGYGYRPLRTVGAMLGVWVVCSLFYYGASVTGTMAPSDAITVEQHAGGCGKPIGALHSTWTTCPELPKEYTTFSPWFYSLDVILPLVDLQQEKSWAPLVMEDDAKTWIWRGVIVRFVMWFEILFGWGASLLLAAVLGNLPKRD